VEPHAGDFSSAKRSQINVQLTKRARGLFAQEFAADLVMRTGASLGKDYAAAGSRQMCGEHAARWSTANDECARPGHYEFAVRQQR
jgi:hypothetical protein